MDDNQNTSDLLVSFYKNGVSIETVVSPLRRDEARGSAMAQISLKTEIPNIDKWLEGASCTISTAPTFK